MEKEGAYNSDIIGVYGETYAERKANLLKQLGFTNVSSDMFNGMSEIQIDNIARDILNGRK